MPSIADNAEHTFNCDRWATSRASLIVEMERIAPDNIVGTMLRGEDIWNHVAHYIEGILLVKKRNLEHL